MNREDYLKRIGAIRENLGADLKTLKYLQRQHLLHTPFENLDIHWGQVIRLDPEEFFQKIVERRRGGFCYELNGLFYQLLGDLRFKSKIISARVSTGSGDFGPEYDHLAILTEIDSDEYLADVGFGDFTAEPLRFVPDLEQTDANGTFLIRKYDEDYFEVCKRDDSEWKSEYIFKPKERALTDFAGMCEFHQTSPDSHFTLGKVCSLMTADGRKTLTDDRFIETKNGQKNETMVGFEADFREILEREFMIQSPE